jgi:NTE family protein
MVRPVKGIGYLAGWMKGAQRPAADVLALLGPAGARHAFYPPELRLRLSEFPLMRDVGAKALGALLDTAQWFSLPGGTVLERAGENDQAVFLVVAGCLGVYAADEEGQDHFVANVPAGETVGEMAVISGEAHSAKLVALRDSELLRIGKAEFQHLIARHPRLSLNLMQLLVQRLRQTTRRAVTVQRVRTIALIPLHEGIDCRALGRTLTQAFAEMSLATGALGPEATGQASDWFARYEAGHDIVLYQGDAVDGLWTQQCLRQADRVVLVARLGEAVASHPLLNEPIGRLKRQMPELILLRGAGGGLSSMPRGLIGPYGLHHYVRDGDVQDIKRLARLLTGRAVGLVLAGGGARGFAHIGVVKALREAGVPFDLIGGSSMGAIVAAGVAMGWDHDELSRRMRRAFVETNPLSDFTLPLLAVFRGKKVTKMLHDNFGDMLIEDMHPTYFCVASNLTSGRAEVLTEGPLWRALRASVAIPGLLPPIIYEKHLLVDGGLMNNFPVDIMASYARGPIVGVDVAGDEAPIAEAENFSEQSWWPLFRQQLKGAPSIVSILMRSGTVGNEAQRRLAREQADMLFDPPLVGVGLRSWQAFDRAVAEGYSHAAGLIETHGIDALMSRQGDAQARLPQWRRDLSR